MYSDVVLEFQSRSRCTNVLSALKVLDKTPKSIIGGHIDNEGFFQNDQSMPVVVHSQEMTIECVGIQRDGDVLMLVEAHGNFEHIQLYSYDFCGSRKTIWAEAINNDGIGFLQPFETGIPLLQLGTALIVHVTFSADSQMVWTLKTHFMYFQKDFRRILATYRTPYDDDAGVKLKHQSGKTAQIVGIRDHGFSPNRMYFIS